MAEYTLSANDREIVEEVLTIAQRVVDLQYDDDVADQMEALLIHTAEIFGIPTHKITVTEQEDGTIVVTSETETAEPKPAWTPRIVSSDDDVNKD